MANKDGAKIEVTWRRLHVASTLWAFTMRSNSFFVFHICLFTFQIRLEHDKFGWEFFYGR